MMTLRSATRLGLPSLLLLTLLSAPTYAQRATRGAAKPAPDLANVKYGPHERNVLDLWKAKSDQPTPLVVFIHGGGFRGGSKQALSSALLEGLLATGISVMAINYRLSPEVSFPAHYMDCARAIQFARSKAGEWHLDPKRVGATGGSAGAGTSLWIGFHDDMDDPNNADPVLRQSTRLTCMAVQGAQSSYDPRVIKEWVGEAASRHPALPGFFGVKADEADTPEAHKIYEAASAINYLTKDDPPVYAFYSEARKLPPDPRPGQGIHHINFGLRLKERMDKLGIECVVRHRDEGAVADKEMVEFFGKHLAQRPQADQANLARPQVSEEASPVEVIEAPTRDNHKATAALRKPPGKAPFPAVVLLEGGMGRKTLERGVESRKEVLLHGQQYCRFLAAGYVTVAPMRRGSKRDPQSPESVNDILAVVEHLKKTPEVDPKSIVVFGNSGGSSFALDLATETEICAIGAGEPASVLFTGMFSRENRDLKQIMEEPKRFYTPELQKRTRDKVERINCAILIAHGDQHPINKVSEEILIPELKRAGKKLEVIHYPGQPHSFYFGGRGTEEATKKAFEDTHAFFKKHLPTQPVPLDELLVKQVPVGRR